MNQNEILENLRVSYQANSLDVVDCDVNPEKQFEKWFAEVLSSQCDEPNAFTLSTVSKGQPRGRVVLLKGIEEGSFLFYTNYKSSKGNEIRENDKVSMTFLWLPLQRQVRIEGVISKVTADKSDDYFQKRPRGSQIGAIASPQSGVVSSRSELEKMFEETEKKFENQQVLPRPDHWGGYAIKPTYFEFWQGRKNRLHDRIAYLKQASTWVRQRLAP
jgi:pyridoxamine 5'-phosphate oxidase